MPQREIIEAEACTPVDESIVNQARKILASEDRSEMVQMFTILLDHYEKTSGEVKLCRYFLQLTLYAQNIFLFAAND